jgi:hypothetical protein
MPEHSCVDNLDLPAGTIIPFGTKFVLQDVPGFPLPVLHHQKVETSDWPSSAPAEFAPGGRLLSTAFLYPRTAATLAHHLKEFSKVPENRE